MSDTTRGAEMHLYRVQITEGRGNEFLWSESANDDDDAVRRARRAFEGENRRPPDHALVTLEQA
jgi:hypothetical protein